VFHYSEKGKYFSENRIKSNFNLINLKKNDYISPRQQKMDMSTLNHSQHLSRQKIVICHQRILLMSYFKSFEILQGLK
jgi:hypothetical protein